MVISAEVVHHSISLMLSDLFMAIKDTEMLTSMMPRILELKHFFLFPLFFLERNYRKFYEDNFYAVVKIKDGEYKSGLYPNYESDVKIGLSIWKAFALSMGKKMGKKCTKSFEESKYYFVDLKVLKATVIKLQASY